MTDEKTNILSSANTLSGGFIPDKEISIDVEHTLDQTTAKFKSVEDGLPELIKNSKDHYARLGVFEKAMRQIVVIISNDKTKLGVLDFGGAELVDFEGWKTWSSRVAGRKERSLDIEAGFGNGGKAFMVRGCSNESSLTGYANKMINKWGFKNNDLHLRYRAGIFTDEKGKQFVNYLNGTPIDSLNKELSNLGINFSDLPKQAQDVFTARQRFTLVVLDGVIDWKGTQYSKKRMIQTLPEKLVSHAQAALTIESSTVWLQLGTSLMNELPLEVIDLPPIKGLETIPPIVVPETLVDPESGEKVKISKGILVLKTSERNLRTFGHYITRNVIRLKNERNVVANWNLPDLVSVPASGFIYGYLECAELTSENLASSDRSILVSNPLTRALKQWTIERVEELTAIVQRLKAVSVEDEDHDTSQKTLAELRKLMSKYFEDIQSSGSGKSSVQEGISETEIEERKEDKKVTSAVLESGRESISIAKTTTVPIIVKFYNRHKKEIHGVAWHILAEDPDVIAPYKQNTIIGEHAGVTNICVQVDNSRIRSNLVEVNVVDVESLTMSTFNEPLKQGESRKLDIHAKDKKGEIVPDMIYEIHTDDPELGRINRDGLFTADSTPGVATLRAIYGEHKYTETPVEVGFDTLNKDKPTTKGLPYILLCGSPAPNTEDLPEELRSHPGGLDYPTLIDFEPIWENVIWINPSSREAMKVRESRHGSIGTSTRTFQDFLALKCFEILKRLKVQNKFGEEVMNTRAFLTELAEAEMETSDFLEHAYNIVEKLLV